MEPMPSGNRALGNGLADGLRAPQGGTPGGTVTRDDRNRATDPMPSGDAGGQLAREGAEAAGGVGGAGAERDVGASAAAMDEPGGAAARETFGRARAGAEAAMQPAAAIAHGRLAAAPADAGLGAAMRRGKEDARAVAILEPAAAGGRRSCGRN